MDGNASSRRTSLSSGLDTSAIGSDVLVSLSVPSSAMDEQRGFDGPSEPAVRSSRSAIETAYTEALALLEIDEKPSSSLNDGPSAAQLLMQARMKSTNMPSSTAPPSTASTTTAPTTSNPPKPMTAPVLDHPSSEMHAHASSNGSSATDVPSSEGSQEQGQEGGLRMQTLRELAVAAGYSSTAGSGPSDAAAALVARPSARSAGAILRRGHAGLASTGSLALRGETEIAATAATAAPAVAGASGPGQVLGYGLRLSRSFSAPVEFTTAHRALPSAPPSERPLDTAIAVPVHALPATSGHLQHSTPLAASASAPPAPVSSRHMGSSSMTYVVAESHPPPPLLTPQPVPTAPPPATANTTPIAEPGPQQVQLVQQPQAEVPLQRSEPVRQADTEVAAMRVQVDKPRGRSSAAPVLQPPQLHTAGGGVHAPTVAYGQSWGASAVALAPPALPAFALAPVHEGAGRSSRPERPGDAGSAGAGPSTAPAPATSSSHTAPAVGGRRQSAGPALPHFPAPDLLSLGGTAARTLQPPSLGVSAKAHGLVGAAVVAIQHPQPLPVTYALMPLRGASAGEDDGDGSRKKADRLSLLPPNAPLPPPMLARAGSPHKALVHAPTLPPRVVAPQAAAAAGPPPPPLSMPILGGQRSGALAVAVPLPSQHVPPSTYSMPMQQQQEGPPSRLPMARQGREPHAGGVQHAAAPHGLAGAGAGAGPVSQPVLAPPVHQPTPQAAPREATEGDASTAVPPQSVWLSRATLPGQPAVPAPPPPPSAPAVSAFGGLQAGLQAQAVSAGVESPPSSSSSSSPSAPPSPVQSALLQHLRESIALTESLLSPSMQQHPVPVPTSSSTLPPDAADKIGAEQKEEEEEEVAGPAESTVPVPSSLLQSLLNGGGEAEERLARLLLARAGHTPARVAAGGAGGVKGGVAAARSAVVGGMAGLASPEGPIEVSSLFEQLQKIAAESHVSASVSDSGTASGVAGQGAGVQGKVHDKDLSYSYDGQPDDMQVSPMRQYSPPKGGERERGEEEEGESGLDGPADPIPDFEQALAALSRAEATVAKALHGALSQGGKGAQAGKSVRSGSGSSVQGQGKVPTGTMPRGVPLHTASRAHARHQGQGAGASVTGSSSAAAAAVRATAQPRPTFHASESPTAVDSFPAPSTAATATGQQYSRTAAASSTPRRRHSDVRGSTGKPYTSLSQTAAESHMMMQFAEALQVLLHSPTPPPAQASHPGRTASSTVRSTSPRSGAPITITTTTVDPSALLPLLPPPPGGRGSASGGPVRGQLQASSPSAATRRSPSPVRAHRLSPRSVAQGQATDPDMRLLESLGVEQRGGSMYHLPNGGADVGTGAWEGDTLPILQLTPQGPVYRSPPKQQQQAQPQPAAPDSTRKLAAALESLLGLGLPLESMMAVVAAAVGGSRGGGGQQGATAAAAVGEALDVDAVTGHGSGSGASLGHGYGSASVVPSSSSSSSTSAPASSVPASTRPVVTFTKHVQAALSAQQKDPHAWRAAVVVAPLRPGAHGAASGGGYTRRGVGGGGVQEQELSASQHLSHSRGPHRGQALHYFEQALARTAVSQGKEADERLGDHSDHPLSASSATGLSHITPLRAKYVIPPFPGRR